MDERTFYRRLAALLEAVDQLPEPNRVALARCMAPKSDTALGLCHEFAQMTDALRLGVTYQAFDLEATRRENRYLRRIIEEQARARSEDDDE